MSIEKFVSIYGFNKLVSYLNFEIIIKISI